MKIIELNQNQYRSYARIHSRRNIFQSVEYATMYENASYKASYYGLVDDNNNLCAATLILSAKMKGAYLYGYAPRGFLIDYDNQELFKTFTTLLKGYLKKKKFVFVKLDPLVLYRKFDKDNQLLFENKTIVEDLKKLGFIHLGYHDFFQGTNPRCFAVLECDDLNSAYENLSRNVKRSIKQSLKMGISIHKGSLDNIELFYSLIRKKDRKSIDYYKDLLRYYSSEDNKMELYFSKIDPKIYIQNFRYLESVELKKNQDLHNQIMNSKVKSQKLISKKMFSDKLLSRYKSEIVKASNIYGKFPNGLVIGTLAIIRNNREVNFIVDGYEEKLREVHSSYLLKWEVIKKYINEGYKTFNLGEVSNIREVDNNKYYGLYLSKINFNAVVNEYPGEFDLVINPTIYSIFCNIMKLKK